MSGWRQRVGRDDMKRLRSELRKAFPMGPRPYHPYKMWLAEIKDQLEPSANLDGSIKSIDPLPGQLEMF